MHIKEFFYIRKSDRSAILVLLAIALVCMGLFFVLGDDSTDDITAFASDSDSVAADKAKTTEFYAVAETKPEQFPFDPNTADSTQFLRLGLQPWQVRNIYKYRARGGIYRQPSDFARLYGLTQKQYRELEPYIRISSDYRPASELVKGNNGYSSYPERAAGSQSQTATAAGQQQTSGAESPQTANLAKVGYPKKLHPGEFVTLNQSDTTALKTVPGIGSYYARQIVNYGKRLGGYANPNQLLEIEGFPEEAVSYFHVDPASIHRLNVNELSLSKLRQHPYLNFYQARAITDYRRLKGPLKSLDDLRLLPEFPPEVIERLKPYVSF
ncbi:MAG: helix-hairpin-helix domain-containing protein [Prevotella sp.]|nr:helix-hairpin-helix domain-containing protein [Prevotella sp.]